MAYLDTKAAAKHCGVGKSTLEKLRLTGGGPRYFKPSRAVRYLAADLDAWMESRARNSTSDSGAGWNAVPDSIRVEIMSRYEG